MSFRARRSFATALVITSLAAAAVVRTHDAQAAPKSHVRATLVAENEWIEPGKPLSVGLRLEMEDGWHTYWRNPGDAGLPPKLSWRLPEGFAAGPIQWPVPQRIAAPPLMSYGYEVDVLLPMTVETPATLVGGGDVRLAGRADWVECKEVCIPGRSEVELLVPVRAEPSRPSAAASLFAKARDAQPQAAEGWSIEAEAVAGTILLSFDPPGSARADEAYFFPGEPGTVEHPAPQVLHPGDGRHRLDIPRAAGRTEPLTRLDGVLWTSARAVRVDVPVAAIASIPPPPAKPRTRASGLLMAVGFAFLGGLILNLMPCVLPVLSLKLFSFVKQAGDEPGKARMHGTIFTAGVLVSFWALAGALLLFRALGQKVGWGFQLQSPAFVVFLSFLFFLLGLSLFGVFELGSSLIAAGNLTAGKSGLPHSFWNGVLATLVATPCTAPFMGSALGYGLSQPAAISFLVFTALGLGMAAPYLVLSANPRLLRLLPRPGPWMEGFKQLMGFCLMATVIALLWLFGQQTGVDAMAVLLGALLVAGIGAWTYGRPASSARRRALRIGSAVALLAAGLVLGFSQARPSAISATPSRAGDLRWEPWSEARVAELRALGRPIFVDFTAAWCLTCKVNEMVALDTREVLERFARDGVVLLKADWTLRDDRITRALASYGRQGVPAYVLYGRDPGSEPHLLPEVLTPGVVISALDLVLGPKAAATR